VPLVTYSAIEPPEELLGVYSRASLLHLMPCPYFEPRNVVEQPAQANARLPLIDEYEGLCHAGSQPAEAPAELRFRCCNHGYSKGCCERFPSEETRSAMRYSVLRQNESGLDLICIEEHNYGPLRWRTLRYRVDETPVQKATLQAGGALHQSGTECLEPELDDACIRAQAVAFCRSYLRHFP
jgi:hypothetical protein